MNYAELFHHPKSISVGDDQFGMVSAKFSRYQPGIRGFIVVPGWRTNGKGLDRIRGHLLGNGDYGRAVNAARQKSPDRYIGNHATFHGASE